MAITPCGTYGLGWVDSCAVDAEATGSASAGQGECSRNTQLAISKREPLPPRGVAFRDCATGGSCDEFLVGVDDLGGWFALVPFSSVGSMMVVVGEVVGEVAA